MKNKETLEEAMANSYIDFAKSNEDVSLYSFVAGWDKGVKYQQKRSYSEEEVNEIIAEAWNSCEDNEGETFTEVRKRIIEQFKKK